MLYRAMLRLAMFMCAGMLLFVGALHLRPYQYPAGFELIMPEPGCESHCILGIEPGVTTLDEAIALLESHPAVEQVFTDEVSANITWIWKADLGHLHPDLGRNSIFTNNDLTHSMYIPLNMPLRDIRMFYGVPENIRARVSEYNMAIVGEDYSNFAIDYTFNCKNDLNLIQLPNLNLRQSPLSLQIVPSASRNLFAATKC